MIGRSALGFQMDNKVRFKNSASQRQPQPKKKRFGLGDVLSGAFPIPHYVADAWPEDDPGRP